MERPIQIFLYHQLLLFYLDLTPQGMNITTVLIIFLGNIPPVLLPTDQNYDTLLLL